MGTSLPLVPTGGAVPQAVHAPLPKGSPCPAVGARHLLGGAGQDRPRGHLGVSGSGRALLLPRGAAEAHERPAGRAEEGASVRDAAHVALPALRAAGVRARDLHGAGHARDADGLSVAGTSTQVPSASVALLGPPPRRLDVGEQRAGLHGQGHAHRLALVLRVAHDRAAVVDEPGRRSARQLLDHGHGFCLHCNKGGHDCRDHPSSLSCACAERLIRQVDFHGAQQPNRCWEVLREEHHGARAAADVAEGHGGAGRGHPGALLQPERHTAANHRARVARDAGQVALAVIDERVRAGVDVHAASSASGRRDWVVVAARAEVRPRALHHVAQGPPARDAAGAVAGHLVEQPRRVHEELVVVGEDGVHHVEGGQGIQLAEQHGRVGVGDQAAHTRVFPLLGVGPHDAELAVPAVEGVPVQGRQDPHAMHVRHHLLPLHRQQGTPKHALLHQRATGSACFGFGSARVITVAAAGTAALHAAPLMHELSRGRLFLDLAAVGILELTGCPLSRRHLKRSLPVGKAGWSGPTCSRR
mmetsp:Transcript_16772/g.52860  ORF Transcript_16772/g.52860 Transcript_16772/m.52860 type:complete len:529 (-) Transcript_16772:685-2271(-)